MAVLILLSTVSFTVKKKYCADNLVDVTVLSEFKGCCGVKTKDLTKEVKNNCCSEKNEVIEGQQIFNNFSFTDLEYSQKLVLVAFVYSYKNLFEGLPQYYIPYQHYSPPNLVFDKQPLEQVYII